MYHTLTEAKRTLRLINHNTNNIQKDRLLPETGLYKCQDKQSLDRLRLRKPYIKCGILHTFCEVCKRFGNFTRAQSACHDCGLSFYGDHPVGATPCGCPGRAYGPVHTRGGLSFFANIDWVVAFPKGGIVLSVLYLQRRHAPASAKGKPCRDEPAGLVNPGDDLLSPVRTTIGRTGLASVFGMGTGVSPCV